MGRRGAGRQRDDRRNARHTIYIGKSSPAATAKSTMGTSEEVQPNVDRCHTIIYHTESYTRHHF